jgi:hypothetical protein
MMEIAIYKKRRAQKDSTKKLQEIDSMRLKSRFVEPIVYME